MRPVSESLPFLKALQRNLEAFQSKTLESPLLGSGLSHHLSFLFSCLLSYLRILLKKIDPGGTVDEWMANIAKLIDKEPIHIEKQNLKYLLDGKSEVEMKKIVGYFPKKNGLGEYKLGIRVTENPQGDYYLVTILTKQD
jgi:hypothetical protein